MTKIDEVENQYLNIVIPSQQGSRTFTPCNYVRNNTNSLLYNPNNYKLAVSRFQIPTSTIPIFVFENDPNGTLTDSIYTIYIFDKGLPTVLYQANVQYIPLECELNQTQPLYYVYSYTRFLEMINATIASLQNTVDPLVTPPKFYFNSDSQNLFLTTTDDYLLSTGRFQLFCNDKLYRFFDGFEIQRNLAQNILLTSSTVNIPLFEFIIRELYDNLDSNNLRITKSELNTLASWNSFSSFQINSNLSINNEYIDLEYGGNGKATNAENVLADFIVNYNDNNYTARTTVNFSINEWNYIDVIGSDPLRNIQINIFWIDTKGIKRQHLLRDGEVAFIKLMFRSKYLI